MLDYTIDAQGNVKFDKGLFVTSEFGAFEWAHLVEPDTKFNDMGDFKVNVAVKADAAEALVTQITDLKEWAVGVYKEAAEQSKKPGKKAKVVKVSDIDPFEELESGDIQFKPKRKAGYVKDNGEIEKFEVKLFDARGKEIEGDPNIGNGTIGRFRATLLPYNMATSGVGIQMRLFDVQIKELVKYDGGGTGYDDVSGDEGQPGVGGYDDAGAGYQV